jgi:hypothetical protein
MTHESKLIIERLREYGQNPMPPRAKKVAPSEVETRSNNPVPPKPKPKPASSNK